MMKRLIVYAVKALRETRNSSPAASSTSLLFNSSWTSHKCHRGIQDARWSMAKNTQISRFIASAASSSAMLKGSISKNESRIVRIDEASTSSTPLTHMDAEDFRAKHNIQVRGDESSSIPDPVQTFEQAGFPPPLLERVKKAGYTNPTPVQAQCWPIANSGRDLIAIASTGSGKTAGFLVPALNHIREANRKRGSDRPSTAPTVLVLAPTRELACQTMAEAKKLGGSLGLRVACLYGGASKYLQAAEIKAAPHIVVATPGRLLDFAESGVLNLESISYLVLDEADRMLDLGFERDLREVLRYIPGERQTLFFSATWPEDVRAVARKFANNNPVQLFVGNVSDRPVAAATITQKIKVVRNDDDKVEALMTYLAATEKEDRVIVFVAQKARCDWLADQLSRNPGRTYRVSVIHGDKMQTARDYALNKFKSGKSTILIATDVASRGLDVKDVTAVVNFDCPNDAESYVHRIGRTGRAGALGESMTFMKSDDAGIARSIAKVMREAGHEVPDELEDLMQSNRGFGDRRSFSGRRGGRGGFGGGQQRGGRGGFGSSRGQDGQFSDRRGMRQSDRHPDEW